ncbi:MAG: hypothetical protein IV100_09975, partial [Myxococcales bacterium]|nr:hypothetical protein [Myxococcales bacterium]
MTVFTVPPRDIALEVGEDRLGRAEVVSGLLASEVTMVSLADFIVVPNHAVAYDRNKAVYEALRYGVKVR